MAIMQRCFCFNNVRSGSMACGVYSLITSCIYLAVWSWKLAQFVNIFAEAGLKGPVVSGIYAAYGIDIVVAHHLLITSIVLLAGVYQDNGAMLIPYMMAIVALMGFQAISWIILFVLGVASIVNLVFWLIFTALNITCLICVISQYQELREGRGKASDVAQP